MLASIVTQSAAMTWKELVNHRQLHEVLYSEGETVNVYEYPPNENSRDQPEAALEPRIESHDPWITHRLIEAEVVEP